MKKSFKMLGMAAMVLLLAVSCKKENKEEAAGETKAMTFTAGINQGNGKTYLEGQKLLWSEGDVININNHDFTLTEGKGTNKGVFTGEATEADFYYAVYPSSGTLDGNTATITLPAEQPYVAGSFYKDIAPMVAMTDDSKSLTFTNVCGLLRLDFTNITKQFDQIVLKSAKEEYLAGEGTVAITGDGNESLVLTDASSNSKTITMSTSDGTIGNQVVFVLPAGTLKDGFNVSFYADGEQFDAASTSADMEIVAGEMNVVTVNHEVKIQAATIRPDAVTTTTLEVPYEIKDECVSASIQCATDEEFTNIVGTKNIELPNSKAYTSGSVTFEGLQEATLYHVRILVKTSGDQEEIPYCTIVAETLGGGSQHEYVDLGLPSGTLWATCNLGADSPEGYGYYFAWGETVTKDVYSWESYKYANGGFKKLTKYCNKTKYGDGGYTDNLTTLEAFDDAAISKWGDTWRMPTMNDWDELATNTYCHWEYDYKGISGLNGLVVYKVKDAADKGLMTVDENAGEDWVEWVTYDQDWEPGAHVTGTYDYRSDLHLFLPAASKKDDLSVDMDYHYGYYWSSSLYTSEPYNAYHFSFSMSYFVDPQSKIDRCFGLSVRPVTDVVD